VCSESGLPDDLSWGRLGYIRWLGMARDLCHSKATHPLDHTDFTTITDGVHITLVSSSQMRWHNQPISCSESSVVSLRDWPPSWCNLGPQYLLKNEVRCFSGRRATDWPSIRRSGGCKTAKQLIGHHELIMTVVRACQEPARFAVSRPRADTLSIVGGPHNTHADYGRFMGRGKTVGGSPLCL